jgi:branched-chain amino acid transport system substrate-binding protein
LTRRPTALWTAAAVLVALLPVATGCGGDDAERAGTQPVAGTKLTIYASIPSRGDDAASAEALRRGAELALAERGGRVGRYTVRLRALDAGRGDESSVRSNGRRAVQDDTTVGYIGELDSQLTKVTMPQLNAAGIAQVGPTNTYTGLTTGGEGAEPGEPDKYLRTGVRTFARLVPRDTVQGAALAAAAREAGCQKLQVWRSNTPYGQGLAKSVESAAADAGPDVSGVEEIKPRRPSYARAAERVDADCLVWAGEPERSGAQVLNDAAEGNAGLRLFAGDVHCTAAGLDARGGISSEAAARLRCTHPVIEPRTAAGRRVVERSGGDAYSAYGYEAMAVLLDAVKEAASKGEPVSRATVSEAVYSLGQRDGAIGRYEIDSNGDTGSRAFGLYEIRGGDLRLEKVLQPAG